MKPKFIQNDMNLRDDSEDESSKDFSQGASYDNLLTNRGRVAPEDLYLNRQKGSSAPLRFDPNPKNTYNPVDKEAQPISTMGEERKVAYGEEEDKSHLSALSQPGFNLFSRRRHKDKEEKERKLKDRKVGHR